MAGKVNYEKYLDIANVLMLVLDRNGNIAYANRKFCESIGYKKEDVFGKNIFESFLRDEAKEKLHGLFLQLINGEIDSIEHLESLLPSRFSEPRVVIWNHMPLHDDEGTIIGTISSGDDITERKKMEDALKHSEQKYRELVQNASSIIMRMDTQGKITFMNEFGLRFFGFTEEELVGKDVVGTISPEVDTAGHDLTTMIDEIVQQPDLFVENENENIRKNGERMWVYWTNSAIIDKYGNVVEILSVGNDITDKKEASDSLRDVNRHLIALIECNQAMVHSQTEHALLQDICNIVVDAAGYTMTWVGLAQYDNSKDILPVAWAGYEEGFLKEAKFKWDESELGKGAIGTAIRTGKPFVSADISTDPRFTPWREAALARGYQSVLAIPIFVEVKDMAYGAIVIYSALPDAFDTEDIKLLMELGRDVTYGLITLRLRRKLELNQRFLSDIFNSVQDGISVLDTDLNILQVNSVMEKWYAHAMPIVGKKCFEVYHGRKEHCEVCPTLRTLATGKSAYDVVPKTGPGGVVEGWQDLYSFPLIDSATGKITGVIEYVRDITERKKAEEALQKKEEFFREVTENSSDIVIIVDDKARIIYASPSIEHAIGYKPDELLGKSGFSLIVPADLPRATMDFGRAILSKESAIPNSFRVRHRDGSEHFLEGFGKNLLDNPAIAGFVMNVRDITERKKAEDLLERSAKEISVALDTANMGIWQADLVSGEVNTLHGGGPISGLSGYPKNEKDFINLVHPEDRARVVEQLRLVREGKDDYKAEFRIVPPNGETRWVYANGKALRDASGKVVSLVGADLDITDRKRAQEETEIFQKFAQNAGQGFGMATLDGNITYVNQALCRVFEEDKPENALNKNILHYYPPEWHDNLRNVVLPTVLSKGQWTGESVLVSNKGKRTPVIENIFLIHDDKGNPQFFANVITDITERTKLEEALWGTERCFSAIFENASDGMILADTETRHFLASNKTICQMLGYSLEEMNKLDVAAIHPDETLPFVLGQFEKLMKKEITVAKDIPMRRKDGSVFYGDVYAFPVAFAGRNYLLGIFKGVRT